MPLVSRTRAILRNAELGFLGVMVRTCTQTPRLSGLPFGTAYRRWRSALKLKRSAGAAVFFLSFARPLRTSWLIVGNEVPIPTFLRTPIDKCTGLVFSSATSAKVVSRSSFGSRKLRRIRVGEAGTRVDGCGALFLRS